MPRKGLRCWYVIQWSRGVARSLPRGARLAPAARALGQAGHGLAGPGPGRRRHVERRERRERPARRMRRRHGATVTVGVHVTVHCVVHSGGDLHAIHTAVMVMLGAARTRTGDRRRALYRRRHTGHDMVERRVHEANAARGRPRRDGLWRRTPTRPMTPSAAGASGTIVRGRCRPPEQLAGCTPCGRVVDTSPARGLGFTL